MKYTQISPDAFKHLQLNAGIILSAFDPATGGFDRSDIIAATGGGTTFTSTPTYTDFGEGIDNIPLNTKELKRLQNTEAKLSGTAKTMSTEAARLFLASADVDPASGKLTPRADLLPSDFADVWWVGDYGDVNVGDDAGFIAIRVIDALNTGGFSLKSNDKDKADIAFEFVGHYSLADITVVPFEMFIREGSSGEEDATLASLTVGSLTLDPVFDPQVETYRTTTQNASNTVTATAADPDAQVALSANGVEFESGTSVTWQEGENTVSVTVTNGEARKTYTVTVEKE